jgi:lipopolysaccharide export system protein LptA
MIARVPQQRSRLAAIAGLSLAAALVAGRCEAQSGPPNALQGFSQNRNLPVKIQAATLEVRNTDKVATFGGGVHVSQGDTDMCSKTLVVFYETDGGKTGLKAAQPGPGGQQQIRRIEATGGVQVTQKEQNASGETGIFDMRSNTVTLQGNVVVTRGPNVLRGQRIVVDLTTGVSKIESNGFGGVEALIQSTRTDAAGGKEVVPCRPPRTN